MECNSSHSAETDAIHLLGHSRFSRSRLCYGSLRTPYNSHSHTRVPDSRSRAGALAINCDLEIQDTPGYFPLHQDENLTELVKKHILDYIDESMVAQGTHGFASGDMGDLSLMWPIVEIGVAGFEGSIHGKDFKTADPEQAYCVPAHYFADTVADLLSDGGASAWKIKEAFKPVMNKKNYLETLDSLNKSTFYEKENN